MHYTLPVLTFVGLVSASAVSLTQRAPISTGGVYAYECGNCDCDAVATNTGFSGTSACFANSWGGNLRALGLTGQSHGSKTTCSLFTSGDCSGNVAQSIGVASGQTWGCTAFNQNIGSYKCYYNA